MDDDYLRSSSTTPSAWVSDDVKTTLRSLQKTLFDLRKFIQNSKFGGSGSGAEIQIRHFVLKAKEDIEKQFGNICLAKKKTFVWPKQLFQTLHQLTENAAQLLSTMHNTRSNEAAADDTQSVCYPKLEEGTKLSISPNHEIEEEASHRDVYACLNGKRNLIVLDDLWSTEHWDALKLIFGGSSGKGSCILLTSRFYGVAEYACAVKGLSDVVSSNVNLQTLVVSCSDSESQVGAPILHLPSTIWESRQLRHLELGTCYTVNPPSMAKENLQTLSWVGPTHCRKKVYSSFPNMKKLKIFCKEELEPSHIGGSSSKHIFLDKLDYLVGLKSLTISVCIGSFVTLPEICMFPSRLKKLRLSGTRVSGWDLKVIGRLKCLKVLKLENVFHEEVWRVGEGEFNELKFLLLEDKILKRLEAVKYSFLLLERMDLRLCNCLEEIPSCLGESYLLKSIDLDRCCLPSIITSARDIQEKLKKNFGKENFEIKIQGQGLEYIEESGEDVELSRAKEYEMEKCVEAQVVIVWKRSLLAFLEKFSASSQLVKEEFWKRKF
nr:putative late blight resistance protein homolog R1A-10 [Ipomoea batatas]